jgi:hypothetical protein
MTEPPGTIRQIAWRELFPWLILFRTFRIAISPTLLALATVAVLATSLGWRIAGLAFLSPTQRTTQASGSQLAAAVPPEVHSYLPSGVRTPLLDAYFELAEPLARFFQLKLTLGESAFYAFGFLWTLTIWAFPGGVITRRAIVQLASDAPPGLRPTITYAGSRYLWYFLAPLYPLLGIVLLAVPITLLGLVLRLSLSLGALVAGLAWLLVAIAGVGAMWLFGGLIFGWPLMWPTISAERDGDPFEAFSRSYSYVYGKPLHYFFYVIVAAALGALSWAIVWGAAVIVREFGFWALAWGGGGLAVAEIRAQALDIAAGEFVWLHDEALWKFGTTLIGLVVALIHAVAAAFRFSFFFCAASAIYLLLRHDVDEKEMDEVYLDANALENSPPARPLATVVTDSPPGSGAA